MAKVKIYQYAKEKGLVSKEIVEKLKNAGFDKVKNQMSSVDESVLLNIIEGKDVPIVEEKVEPKVKKQQVKIIVPKKSPPSVSKSNSIKIVSKQSKQQPSQDKKALIKEAPKKGSQSSVSVGRKPKVVTLKDIESGASATPKTGAKNLKRVKTLPSKKVYDAKKKPTAPVIEEPLKTKTELRKERRESREKEIKESAPITYWHENLSVGEFSKELDIPSSDVIMKLMNLGVMANVNHTIDRDMIDLLALEYNLKVKEKDIQVEYDLDEMIKDQIQEAKMISRPPVVTIMGHVDHGKTTLLDAIRKTNVVKREAGGITQHIGAYKIIYNQKEITFLDTPGHEAFSSMRMRGAKVTDVSIIVVAADDGIMPQTIEAIAHAKEANNKIIVAINKIDKSDSNVEKITSDLSENGLQPEEWGGDIPFIKVSALNGDGISELLDYILLVSEIENYKSPLIENAFGTVIESHIDIGRGAVATVIIQGGKLSQKDSIVIGSTWGVIRSMEDDLKKQVKVAGVSTPVQITGLKKIPKTGEKFISFGNDAKKAQIIGEKLTSIQEAKERQNTQIIDLDKLKEMIANEQIKELAVIIKADVYGAQEALAQSLEKIEVNGVKVRVVLKNVGAVNESDVNLSITSKAMIIAFNVKPDANARKIIEKEKIEFIQENVIYKIIEIIEETMRGMREITYHENNLGMGTIIEVFKISNTGKIAGVMIDEGKALKDAKARIIRDDIVVHDSVIGTLKRFKDNVSSVAAGQDCGIKLEGIEDYKKGDKIEIYELIEEELD